MEEEDAALPWRKRILDFAPDAPRWINVMPLIVTVIAGAAILFLPFHRAVTPKSP